MQMIALSHFTYFAENALEMAAKKRGWGELLWNSCFFRRPVSDVIQCLEISGVKWYCISSHLQLCFTEGLGFPLQAALDCGNVSYDVCEHSHTTRQERWVIILQSDYMISASDLLLLLNVEENLTEAYWYVHGQINYLIDWTNEKNSYVQDCTLFPYDCIIKTNQCCINTMCTNNN